MASLETIGRKILLPHFVAIIELYIFEKGQHGLPRERNDNWKDEQASTTFFFFSFSFFISSFYYQNDLSKSVSPEETDLNKISRFHDVRMVLKAWEI